MATNEQDILARTQPPQTAADELTAGPKSPAGISQTQAKFIELSQQRQGFRAADELGFGTKLAARFSRGATEELALGRGEKYLGGFDKAVQDATNVEGFHPIANVEDAALDIAQTVGTVLGAMPLALATGGMANIGARMAAAKLATKAPAAARIFQAISSHAPAEASRAMRMLHGAGQNVWQGLAYSAVAGPIRTTDDAKSRARIVAEEFGVGVAADAILGMLLGVPGARAGDMARRLLDSDNDIDREMGQLLLERVTKADADAEAGIPIIPPERRIPPPQPETVQGIPVDPRQAAEAAGPGYEVVPADELRAGSPELRPGRGEFGDPRFRGTEPAFDLETRRAGSDVKDLTVEQQGIPAETSGARIMPGELLENPQLREDVSLEANRPFLSRVAEPAPEPGPMGLTPRQTAELQGLVDRGQYATLEEAAADLMGPGGREAAVLDAQTRQAAELEAQTATQEAPVQPRAAGDELAVSPVAREAEAAPGAVSGAAELEVPKVRSVKVQPVVDAIGSAKSVQEVVTAASNLQGMNSRDAAVAMEFAQQRIKELGGMPAPKPAPAAGARGGPGQGPFPGSPGGAARGTVTRTEVKPGAAERRGPGRLSDKEYRAKKAERLKAQRQERRELKVDPMTKLSQPATFQRAKERIDADPNQEWASFDLRGLKQTNDILSPAEGDKLIGRMGRVIREVAEEMGIPERNLFRAGGDEFGVALPKGQAEEFGRAVQEAMGETKIGSSEYVSGARYGVASTWDEAAVATQAAKAKEKGPRGRDFSEAKAAEKAAAEPKTAVTKPKDIAPETLDELAELRVAQIEFRESGDYEKLQGAAFTRRARQLESAVQDARIRLEETGALPDPSQPGVPTVTRMIDVRAHELYTKKHGKPPKKSTIYGDDPQDVGYRQGLEADAAAGVEDPFGVFPPGTNGAIRNAQEAAAEAAGTKKPPTDLAMSREDRAQHFLKKIEELEPRMDALRAESKRKGATDAARRAAKSELRILQDDVERYNILAAEAMSPRAPETPEFVPDVDDEIPDVVMRFGFKENPQPLAGAVDQLGDDRIVALEDALEAVERVHDAVIMNRAVMVEGKNPPGIPSPDAVKRLSKKSKVRRAYDAMREAAGFRESYLTQIEDQYGFEVGDQIREKLNLQPRSLQPTLAQEAAAVKQADASAKEHVPGPPTKGHQGSKTRIVFKGGELEARYKVIELEDLQVSHNAETWTANPKYFPENAVQQRDYLNNKTNREAVVEMAQKPSIPTLLDAGNFPHVGPPVVTPDGLAIAGNGRGMILNRMDVDDYEGYKYLLWEDAERYGFDEEASAAIQKMTRPVLVRELVDESIDPGNIDQMRELNIAFDQPVGKAKTTLEDAASRAARLETKGKAALGHLENTLGVEDPDQTLRAYLDSPDGNDFVQMLRNTGVITTEEAGAFLERGVLTSDGKDAISEMLLVRAVGDANTVRKAPTIIKDRLEHTVPGIIRSRAEADGWDVSGVVRKALDLHAELSTNTAYTGRTGKALAYSEQTGLFGETVPQKVIDMARVLEDLSKRDATGFFRTYFREMDIARSGGQDLFEPKTPDQVFDEVFGAIRRANGKGNPCQ